MATEHQGGRIRRAWKDRTMLLKIGITALLAIGWHFPTTFFVPGGPPYEQGWSIWPFGRQSKPALDMLPGVLAPTALPATGTPTLALVAAGLASLTFLVAIAGLWGFIVPPTWWQPMPLIVDALAVFVVLYQSGSLVQVSTP